MNYFRKKKKLNKIKTKWQQKYFWCNCDITKCKLRNLMEDQLQFNKFPYDWLKFLQRRLVLLHFENNRQDSSSPTALVRVGFSAWMRGWCWKVAVKIQEIHGKLWPIWKKRKYILKIKGFRAEKLPAGSAVSKHFNIRLFTKARVLLIQPRSCLKVFVRLFNKYSMFLKLLIMFYCDRSHPQQILQRLNLDWRLITSHYVRLRSGMRN